MSPEVPPPDRRQLLHSLAVLGIGTAAFQRAAVAEVARADGPPRVTAEMVKNAEWVAGLTLTADERKAVASSLTRTLRGYADARKVELP
ncbi:MAG TPA: hypothetical protein VFG68_19510, partial [Fimbriiglobus sp.]|nr:hypothetical protein [Fimbriiglobus sp.]